MSSGKPFRFKTNYNFLMEIKVSYLSMLLGNMLGL